MPTLQVITALLLIFLFYSLLATTAMEMIAGWLSLRGRHLQRTLKNMLSSRDETVFRAFVGNPLFEQLAGRFFGKKSPPSYLDSASFHSILMKAISKMDKGNTLQEKIGFIPDYKLREVLEQFLEDADYDFQAFQAKVMQWYDNVMDRASGWYKKLIQKWLLLFGFAIALAFNADTLAVYNRLVEDSSANPERIEALVSLAEGVAGQDNNLSEANQDSLYYFLNSSLRMLEGSREADPLGIGWTGFREKMNGMGPLDWLWKILGWLITAVAISLGAPFWFDLLKKVINIRSAGNIPKIVSQVKEYVHPDMEEAAEKIKGEGPVG